MTSGSLVTIDTTRPVITITGDNPDTVSRTGSARSYTDEGATATDAHDGTVNVSTSGSVDMTTAGTYTYTYTYTATDAAGNSSSPAAAPSSSATFTRTLSVGLVGDAVKALQMYLNTHGYPVAASGPDSPGNETNVFGSATRAAVIKLQEAAGIAPVAGVVGPKTRAYIVANP